ncbi:MAG: PhoH family protein [Planctomycetaceae bacterium]
MISQAGMHGSFAEPACEAKTSQNNVKLFVLDTNVILHDSACIFNFEENDIALPITVLEELDRFKKGDGDLNFQARQFLRQLDSLTGDVMSDEGAPLGDGLGRIRVLMSLQSARTRQSFLHDSADHRILNTALAVSELMEEREVVLVTKDTNLRLKAKAFGMISQDYNSDRVQDMHALYTGRRTVNDVPSAVLDQLFQNEGCVPAADVCIVESPVSNENFILRNGSRSVLASFNSELSQFCRITKSSCFGIRPRNAEQSFALQALTDDRIKLITLVGRAGTGKTLLSLAAALDRVAAYRQILLARPIVPLSNRDLGFLPGDVQAKIEPYMQPLFDNLSVIKHENPGSRDMVSQMMEEERLQITPLAYIRGRSLQQTFFIVDEAQNLTPHEVKTIITRAGEGTKIVLTGDIQQIDHPYLDSASNGLTYVINRMKGQHLYAHVTLEKGVRSELSEAASSLL